MLFALVSEANGTEVRVMRVAGSPSGTVTATGWETADIHEAVRALAACGVTFERYAGIDQDADGVWNGPDGTRIAWFGDPGEIAAPPEIAEGSELARLDAAAALVNPCLVRLPRDKKVSPASSEDMLPFASRDEAIAWLESEHQNLLGLAERRIGRADVTVVDALRGYHGERGWDPRWTRLAERALDAAVSAGDVRAQSAMHLALANSCFAGADYAGSAGHGRRALDLSLVADWRDGEAAAYHNLAASALATGDAAASDRYVSLWTKLNEELDDPASVPPGPRAPDWTVLTEREQAIARLVVRGLTNQQVAARAGCSPDTVKFHLRNIFRKLGIRSRAEIARYVLTARGRSLPADGRHLPGWAVTGVAGRLLASLPVTGYRALASPRLVGWAITSVFMRLPVAMAAMSMVFLGRGSPGGYAEGGTLTAVYVTGEVACSGVFGTLLPQRRSRVWLPSGLAVGGASFAVMFLLPRASLAPLCAAAFTAGGAPAIAPGLLRGVLIAAVDDEDVPAALSADSVLTELIWMAAPGLAVLLALQVSARAPLGLCAASMAAASLAALPVRFAPHENEPHESKSHENEPHESEPHARRPGARVLLDAWPVYLTAAAAMSLSAVAELDLPPLLQARHAPAGAAGVLLLVFGALSAAGSYVYGLRTWPGSPYRHSQMFLGLTAVAIVVEALVPSLGGIVIGFLAAGCFQPVVMITRGLALRVSLPDHAQSAGYSLMYAVQGAGYSVTAALASVLIGHVPVSAAILSGVAIAAVLAAVSSSGTRLGLALEEKGELLFVQLSTNMTVQNQPLMLPRAAGQPQP